MSNEAAVFLGRCIVLAASMISGRRIDVERDIRDNIKELPRHSPNNVVKL